MTDQLKLTYLVSQNDLCGRPNSPLIGRPNKLDMSNILAKNPNDLLIDRPLWTSVGSFLVGRITIIGLWNCDFLVSTTKLWSAVLLFAKF